MAVWPFFREEDYKQALKTPKLLKGFNPSEITLEFGGHNP
jgi:hypothetical protein